MAVQTFSIKQHDLLPDMVLTLLDNDVAADLTNAVSARLMMRNITAGLVVNAPVAILDQTVEANLGKVRYSWVTGDTAINGIFNAEVEVMWPGTKPQTFPGNAYFHVQVVNDLDD